MQIYNTTYFRERNTECKHNNYSKIRLLGTHRDHENVFLITEVPFKRIVN